MTKTGRPTKLTEETQTKIVQGIKLGATYELAAQYGGISYNTFNEWMKRGDAEIKRRSGPNVKENTTKWDTEEPFVEFYEAIKETEGEAAILWLAKIEKAATDNWQAAAWKLERRYPNNYGRQVQDVYHTHKNPVPVTLVEVNRPEDG